MGTPIWTSRCRHRHHHHSQRTMNTKGFWSARLNGRNGPANYLNKLVAYILYAAYNRSDWCGMAFCWSFTYIFYLNRNGKIVFSIFHIKIMMIVVVSFFSLSYLSYSLALSLCLVYIQPSRHRLHFLTEIEDPQRSQWAMVVASFVRIIKHERRIECIVFVFFLLRDILIVILNVFALFWRVVFFCISLKKIERKKKRNLFKVKWRRKPDLSQHHELDRENGNFNTNWY